jgi:phosphocarrier protein HPr
MTAAPDETSSPGDAVSPDSPPDLPSSPPGPQPSTAGAIVREVLIVNKRGLHARASAKFVQMVERFNAEVSVTRNGETVGGTSIMGLMMLSAGPGTTVTLSATGAEAEAAVAALAELIESKFGEE